jgi:hypothetical protein
MDVVGRIVGEEGVGALWSGAVLSVVDSAVALGVTTLIDTFSKLCPSRLLSLVSVLSPCYFRHSPRPTPCTRRGAHPRNFHAQHTTEAVSRASLLEVCTAPLESG